MITEKEMQELEFEKPYDITFQTDSETPEERTIECMELESIQQWGKNEILYRFVSKLNDTALVFNKEGKANIQGFITKEIKESEPRIFNNLKIKVSELTEKAKEYFPEDYQKVIDFISTL